MRYAIIVCVFIIFGLGIALPGQEQKPLRPVFSGVNTPTFAVEIFDNIIYMPVSINGQGPFSFILDTGNGGPPALDEDLARHLQIPLGRGNGTGGAGAEQVMFHAIDSLRLSMPGVEYATIPAVTLPLARMDRHWGRRKDGLIGGTIFADVVTTIDYMASTVHFSDPATFSGVPGGTVVPLVRAADAIFVKARIHRWGEAEPVEALLMIDTGVRVTTLNTPLVNKQRLIQQSPKTLATMTGFGIGGKSMGVVGRIKALEIGPIRIENPVVAFSTDTGGAFAMDSFDGIIGADVLHRFHISFDYSRSRMYIQKNAAFAEPFEFDMSGLRLAADGEKFDRFSVFYVAEKSPAQEAGICAGDEIVSIDGKPTSQFDWQTLRRHLQRDGASVLLGIRRQNKLLSLRLHLRRLV